VKIVQVISDLAYGDAMGNHTILTHHLLKQAGFHVETYAGRIRPDVPKGVAKLFSPNINIRPDDIMLLQYGIGGSVPKAAAGFACRRILVYHNITPPEFFRGYDYIAYQGTADGRQLIQSWAENRIFDAVLGYSRYNFEELLALGFPPEQTFYFPGYLFPLQNYQEDPDPDTMEDYSDGATNILFVGRISPNKKQEDTLRAFAYYQKHMDPDARLILVGGGWESPYGNALENYIKELNVKHVIIPGHISSAELISIYHCADVFVCMSEHEGFCIPLIEAMLFDVPILAYRAAAVPDTLGGAGVLLDEKDPILIAKWIERIAKDSALREKILLEQRERLKIFDQTYAGEQMIAFLNNFIAERIKKFQSIDEFGTSEREIGTYIDGTLYDIVSQNLAAIGQRMPFSRRKYLRTVQNWNDRY